MWINNSIVEKQLNPQQEVPEGYVLGRLKRKNTKVEILATKITKEHLYEVYIVNNFTQQKTAEYFKVTKSDIVILLKYYGILKDAKLIAKNNTYVRDHATAVAIGKKSADTQKKRWESLSQEEKDQWSETCKLSHSSEEYRKQRSVISKDIYAKYSKEKLAEINKKRSASLKRYWEAHKLEILQKRSATHKQNVAQSIDICRSKMEQLVLDKLKQLFFEVEYEFLDKQRYPFMCDYYVKKFDLFIELNGHPSHGKKPYSKNIEEQFSHLPTEWYDVYARRDVEKYTVALKNNLNYLRIYPYISLEENIALNPKEFSFVVTNIFKAF